LWFFMAADVMKRQQPLANFRRLGVIVSGDRGQFAQLVIRALLAQQR
jgi:hypothetical protein